MLVIGVKPIKKTEENIKMLGKHKTKPKGSSFKKRMSEGNLQAGKRMLQKNVNGKSVTGRSVTGKEMTTDPWDTTPKKYKRKKI